MNIFSDNNVIENMKFTDDIILLDYSAFVNCIFENCTMLFSGILNIHLDSNQFIGCNWSFCDKATNTLKYLHLLKCEMGVEGNRIYNEIIKNI